MTKKVLNTISAFELQRNYGRHLKKTHDHRRYKTRKVLKKRKLIQETEFRYNQKATRVNGQTEGRRINLNKSNKIAITKK